MTTRRWTAEDLGETDEELNRQDAERWGEPLVDDEEADDVATGQKGEAA